MIFQCDDISGPLGDYPEAIRDFLVGVYRYAFRVETYAGLLTDIYPPFRLAP